MNKFVLTFNLSVLIIFSCKQPTIQKAVESHEIDIYDGIEFEMPEVKTTSFLDYEGNGLSEKAVILN